MASVVLSKIDVGIVICTKKHANSICYSNSSRTNHVCMYVCMYTDPDPTEYGATYRHGCAYIRRTRFV